MPNYQNPLWGGPPAPLVDLIISWNGQSSQVLALLDTGADQTQIPAGTAQTLKLRKIRDKQITDANGQKQVQSVYVANIKFDGVTFDNFPIVATPLQLALVGRDILNRVAVLDGPRLTYSLTPV